MHTYLSMVLPIKDITKDKKEQIENLTLPLLPFSPQIASKSVAREHRMFYFIQTIGVLPRQWRPGHGERQLPGPSSAGSPARSPAAVGSTQPHGDTRATIGLWGPTTRRSNFSTDSLAGIWGRCLPCRHRQPAASGRAPTTANPW